MEQPPDFKFTVVLSAPKKHPLLIMPPKVNKVVREFSPHEKHLLNIYEKRERLRSIKEGKGLAQSARHSALDDSKRSIDQKVERMLNTQLDKVIQPEAASHSQLDLNTNRLQVKNNFSVERTKLLNRQNQQAASQEELKPASPSKQQKRLRQVVSSKFLDASKFHSQRLLDAEPSLKSIVYDKSKKLRDASSSGSPGRRSSQQSEGATGRNDNARLALKSKKSSEELNEYEQGERSRLHSSDPPRVYKLVREKQKNSPSRPEDGKEYVYRGNYQDLQPMFAREGRYRLPANLSQLQYATALRQYHPVDYLKIAQENQIRKEQEELKKFEKHGLTTDSIIEETNGKDLNQEDVERKIRRERNRINKINNGYVS